MTATAAIDPYTVLNVPRTATPAEIERAYRQRAMEAHPDRGGSNRAMRAVNAARKMLVSRAKEFDDPRLDGIKRLCAGKSPNDIRVLRDETAGKVRSFEQRNAFGEYGGPLNSQELARYRLELKYLNALLS